MAQDRIRLAGSAYFTESGGLTTNSADSDRIADKEKGLRALIQANVLIRDSLACSYPFLRRYWEDYTSEIRTGNSRILFSLGLGPGSAEFISETVHSRRWIPVSKWCSADQCGTGPNRSDEEIDYENGPAKF